MTVALLGHYIAYHKNQYVYRAGANYPHVPDHAIFIPELFFLLIATTCLITSALLLISCLISIATATIIPKTVLVSFKLQYLLVQLNDLKYTYIIVLSSFKLRFRSVWLKLKLKSKYFFKGSGIPFRGMHFAAHCSNCLPRLHWVRVQEYSSSQPIHV